jgi:solute:Na+ symporter, SSS family
MNWIDIVIIIAYFSIVILVGVMCRRQGSLKDYFLGGRNVPWWAAMFSGIATIVSAVSYLGGPGIAFAGNYTLHQYRLGMPLAILVICAVMLPLFYYKQRFSIYEYFEERFDLRVRLFASGLFVLMKTCFIGVAIYAPALVMRQMFGVPIWQMVVFVGVITTLYTMVGGIKAVIWTDSLQLFVLIGGLIVVGFLIVQQIDGGLATISSVAGANNKFQVFDFSLDFTTTYTFWGGLIGGAFFMLTQYGSDQAELQRFLATRSLKEARVAVAATMVFAMMVGVGVFFIGTMLFVFYSQHPDKGAFLISSSEVFPKFIVEEMPVGIKGLLVASVLSAAMSTISSVLNSASTVIVADFYNRFAKKQASVRFARWLTVLIGLIGILLGTAA